MATTTADDDFGPQRWPHFDFTLLFSQTILTILPASLLVLATPLYLSRCFKSPAVVSGSIWTWAKLAATSALAGLEIASLVLWATIPAYRTEASLAASSLSCVGAVCIVAIVNLEHRHSLRSSAFISLYLSITFLLDIAKSRSYFARPGLQVVGGLAAATAVVKLALVLLEEIPKRSDGPVTPLCRETTSGFWTRSLFLWLNSTFLLGFRTILDVKHLGNLGPEFASEYLLAKFEPVWEKQRKTHSPTSPILMKATFYTLFWPCCAVVVPRLLNIGFTFSQPFLIQRIVSFLSEESPSVNVRNGLIGATVLIYSGIAITTASHNHMTYRLITRLRGVLVTQIFKKTMVISQSKAKDSAALTLMSTDIDSLVHGTTKLHKIWASIIEFGLGLYCLTRTVGAATFLVAIPAFITTVGAYLLGKRMIPARAAWNKEVEKRVATTWSVLTQIKSIRMMGLGPLVADVIQGLRESEMKRSITYRISYVATFSTGVLCHGLTSILVIIPAVYWTTYKDGLIPTEIFTTLAFISLTAYPLFHIVDSYPVFASMFGCFQRIQEYLLLDECDDKRETISDLILRNEFSEKEIANDSMSLKRSPSIKLQFPQPPVVFVEANISAETGAQTLLHNVTFSINRSEIAVVLGRTSSGKSTLLRAVLGEAQVTHGLIYVEQRKIAYCGQTPWLQDSSIRENIVWETTYEKDWYDTVLTACLLNDDLQQLPDGDLTTAGTGGANLSGGQRQRVALARAVYSRVTLMVLDNVFSSLDQSTAQAIFHRLFSADGLLRRFGSTVIMTTHSVEYTKAADRILMIESDGSVASILNARNMVQDESRFKDFVSATVQEVEGRPSQNENSLENQLAKILPDSEDALSVRQKGDLKLYSFYLASASRHNWIIFLVGVMLVAVTERWPDIFVRIWVEVAAQDKAYVIGYILLTFLSVVLMAVVLFFFFVKIVPDTSENMHQLLLDKVMISSLSFLSSTSSASILNLFSQDMSFLSQELPLSFYLFIYSFFLTVTDAGIISSGTSYMATVIPFICVLLYILQYFYLRTSRQIRHLDLEAKTPLYALFTELATGLTHIRGFGYNIKYLHQSFVLLDFSQRPFYFMFCIQRWLCLVADLIVLGIATALVSFALCTTGQGTASQGSMGLALLNLVNFGVVISGLIEDWRFLETSLGAISRIRSFVQTTPTEQKRCSELELPSGCLQRGAIEMKDVTSTYKSLSSQATVALRDVSLIVKAGQRVAVTGRTGSGKSTLILTLLDFLDYSGVIKIDGVDLTDIPRQALRSMITTIPQDLVELPGSVRNNLIPTTLTRPDDQSHDAKLLDVLERVGLWTYIASRGGLDEPLASMGFSHGQRQLLGVARAIVHQMESGSGLVLIDEATSAMDEETSRAIQQVMKSAFVGCTVITVTHRPEITQSSDVVVQIADGRIASIAERDSRR